METDEHSIILSCQQGDRESFALLYDRYCGPIYRYVYYRTFDKPLAEDLTSQTFLKALEKIGTFDPSRGVFSAWLYRIARNCVFDHLRSAHPTDDLENAPELASEDDPSGDAQRRMAAKEVRAALATLEPLKRDIVLLRLWDGLSYKEIAAIVGKSEGNCKVLFSRTLASLRGTLSPLALLLLLLFPLRP